jgi:RNA polymerase sigma factor (sigma-70 family)
MSNDEWELLRAFAEHRSDTAFAELTRRYTRLVFGRCVRQLGDPHAAGDVTQAVFLVLADRAGSMGPDVPLGAWLYRVAGFACRNEVKMRARRRRHEAAAAALARTAVVEASDVAALAPLLDEAVDRLGATDRRAVLMRYFEGRSVGEVAVALGVPENTAGRRLLRAVGKLRATFQARGVTIPATTVGATVAAVVAATVEPTATAASPAAKATARAVGRSMRWARWEPAVAAGIVGLAMVGGAVALVAGWPPTPVKRPAVVPVVPVAAVVAPAPVDVRRSEAQVPGMIQLAQWDVLLDDAGYPSVAGVGQSVRSASKGYAGRVGDGSALRGAVATAMAAGGVPLVSHESRVVELPQAVYGGKRYSPQFDPMYSLNDGKRYLSLQAISTREADAFDRLADGRVHLHLDHPDLNAGVSDRAYRNPRRIAGGCGIVFDGDLAPGEAVWFVVRLLGQSGKAYYHLCAWESFRATPAQAFVMSFPTDAGWWCRTGPEPLRLWADQARIWADWTGSGRPFGAPSISRKLSNGEIVWLFALCRPSEYPWCWWDPTGQPAALGQGIPFGAGLPDGLWAEVDVSPPLDRIGQMPPDVGDDAWGERDITGMNPVDHAINNGPTPLHLGVPVGPWTEVGRLRYGQPITVGGVRYEITLDPDNPYWPRLTRRGVLDDQFHLVGVHRDGTKADPVMQANRQLMWGEPGLKRDLTESVFAGDMPGVIDHFSIRIRKREFVTFDGFATRPATVPPSNLTRPQADAALARIAAQHLQKGLDQWGSRRVGYLLAWSTHVESWNDGMRILLHAAVALDEATVRKTLSADDPRAAASLDALAHLVVQGEWIRSAAARKFGEATAHDLLDRPGLFEDLQGELVGVGWAGTTGSRYHVHPYTDMESNDGWMPHVIWRQEADGSYALDVDGLLPSSEAIDCLKERCRLADALHQLLSGQSTVDELRRRLAGP